MKNIFTIVGGLLLLVGIAGFVLPRPLFGIFEVDTVHNVIHLLSGCLTMFTAARGIGPIRLWGRIFGIVYLAVGLCGFVSPDLFGLMPVNQADNLLHLALAAVFLYVGFLAPPR